MIASILSAVITGLIIGALGRLIVPGKQNLSILMTILIGIVASLVAGILLGATAYRNSNGGVPWLAIILGALLAAGGIILYGRMSKQKV